jgi:hypothetical protein
MARTNHELRLFSERLLYEVQVFFRVARLLMRLRLGLARPLPWEAEMALIESFALHARALSDFLYVLKGRTDDALAADFFAPGKWERLLPDKGPWLELVKRPGFDRAGKEIIHLTYHRAPVSEEAQGWSVAQVSVALGVVVRIFIERVPKSRVTEAFLDGAWREIPAISRVEWRPGVGPPLWPQGALTRGFGEPA